MMGQGGFLRRFSGFAAVGAVGTLGHYLLRHGLWHGKPLTVEQNGDRQRPNIVRLMAANDGVRTPRVFIGGSAVCRIEGRYLLIGQE